MHQVHVKFGNEKSKRYLGSDKKEKSSLKGISFTAASNPSPDKLFVPYGASRTKKVASKQMPKS